MADVRMLMLKKKTISRAEGNGAPTKKKDFKKKNLLGSQFHHSFRGVSHGSECTVDAGQSGSWAKWLLGKVVAGQSGGWAKWWLGKVVAGQSGGCAERLMGLLMSLVRRLEPRRWISPWLSL